MDLLDTNVFDWARFALRALRQSRPVTMPPEKVLALQQERFRRMLRLAVERSPFYRAKYHGIDIQTCAVSDLPVITKAELMDRFDDVVTDRDVRRADVEEFMQGPSNLGKPFLGKYAPCHTSGSQGQPLILVQDRTQLEIIFAMQLTRGNVRRPGLVEAIRRLAKPARLAVLALPHGFYPSSVVWSHMPEAAKTFVDVHRLDLADEGLISALNVLKPNYITAYVSTLEMLALHRDRLDLHPDLQQVVATSEELTDAAYKRFSKAFGVPVLNNYSMAECNHLSMGCPNCPGVHVNADWAILEVVDEQNRPVPQGQTGAKVLVTNLANEIQPILRYEIGDRVSWAVEPCGCGNNLPLLGRVGGRAAEFFWVRTEKGYQQLLSLVFLDVTLRLDGVREWQAVQETRSRVRVRLERLPGAEVSLAEARQLLEEGLARFGLQGAVEMLVEFVDRLRPDTKSGKMRRVLSLVGEPEDLHAPASESRKSER